MKKKSSQRHHGAALIVVLSILVLVSGLVVGLAMAMRMERSASYYNLERMRADLMARQGVDYGKALLTTSTTNRFWISAPGRIIASPVGTIGPLSTVIDLSSGRTTETNANASANLNRRGWTGGDELLNPSGTAFNVKWIYVSKSGAYSSNGSPDTNTVGRFAFWVDDESSRVDLSTAGARTTNSTDWANPAEIDLAGIAGLGNYITPIQLRSQNGAFSTPNEALGITNAGLRSLLTQNRFYLTHYTQDPEINPWGGGRMVLTTLQGRAYRRDAYINILSDSTNRPGFLSSLQVINVNNILNNLMGKLNQTNWPYVSDPRASWASKYGTNGAAQMALDIVEYVRATEADTTNEAFVEPLTATLTGTNLVYDPTLKASTFSSTTLIGTTRRPLISEVAVALDPIETAGVFSGKLYVEVYLPTGYGITDQDMPNPPYLASDFSGNAPAVASYSATNNTPNGQFLRIEQVISTNATPRPTNAMLRVALFKAASDTAANILDVAPLSATDKINYAIDPTTVATNLINSWEVRDPRVNKYLPNWEHAAANSMFPNPNVNSKWSQVIAPPTGLPPADTSASGAMSQASVQMAGRGIVGSVGELGFINTGVASNMPWRSVRLQPTPGASTNTVPDWALMDLFAAPVVNTNYVPGTNTISGRINLNALLINSDTNTIRARTNVLNTLFTNVITNVFPVAQSNVVSNVIVATNLATNGLNIGEFVGNQAYSSVGQIAEIRGISDAGEESEKVIRQVASLATVRGDVFSVYSVGQALKVSPGGRVNINGEKMVRAIVERTYDGAGNAQYKIIYWSEIYP